MKVNGILQGKTTFLTRYYPTGMADPQLNRVKG